MLRDSEVSTGDQNRALVLATIAFTACFAVWTIFSIIGVAIIMPVAAGHAAAG